MSYKIPQGRLKPKKVSTFGKKPFKGTKKNCKGSLVKTISGGRIKDKAKKLPAYIKWFHEVYQPSCFVCGSLVGVQFHHIKEHSSDERDDMFGLPLCYEHHLGNEFSPHGTPVKFKKVYPMVIQHAWSLEMYNKYLSEIV